MGGGRVPPCFSLDGSESETCRPEGRTSTDKGKLSETGSNAGRCDDERIFEVFHDRLLRSESVTKEGEVSGVLMKLRC